MTFGPANRPRVFPLLVFLFAGAAAASEWDLESLMSRLGERTTYRATFHQTKHLDALEKPLELKGSLVYERPGHLKKVVTHPHEKIYDIRGDTLTIAGPEEETRRLTLADHPLLRTFVATMRGILSGDLKALERDYRLQLEGGPNRWVLRLRPKASEIGERIKRVVVRGRKGKVVSVKTVEANGDFSLLEISPDRVE